MPRDVINTEGVTMARVLQEENLRAAWAAVRRNDGAPGVDGRDIEDNREYIRQHWPEIATQLQNGRYTPGAVRAGQLGDLLNLPSRPLTSPDSHL
jgi:RNA-directed DNA polymerase